MRDLFLWIIVIVLSGGFILYAVSKYNDSAASKAYAKGQARAMILEAQGQSRLDSAQANAVNLASMLPYMIVGLVAVFGGAIIILAVVIMRQQSEARIERIETRYVLLLPQGGSRREMYQLLSDNVRLIGD